MAAEGRGPLMHARIGVMQALNKDSRECSSPVNDEALGQTKDSPRSVTRWLVSMFALFLTGLAAPLIGQAEVPAAIVGHITFSGKFTAVALESAMHATCKSTHEQ